MPEKAVAKTISVYPQDWDLIVKFAKCHRISNSLALRLILQQWRNHRQVEQAHRQGQLTDAERDRRTQEISLLDLE
jgi:hypothetical protein